MRHGATVDKFIGDAMLVFLGDPESRGVADDAKACLHMAIEMQRALQNAIAALDARMALRAAAKPAT